MNVNIIYKLTKFLGVLKHNKQIILVNKYNGFSVKMTQECYKIILEMIKQKMTLECMLKCFEDDEDKEYFERLLIRMSEREIIVPIDNKEIIDINGIAIAITNRCNLHCSHCIAASVNSNINNDLCFSDLKKIFKEAILANPLSITITGGEPMTYKYFFEICEFTKKRYTGKLLLMTNGTLISKDNVKLIVDYFSDVSISLDGIDENSVKNIRGESVFRKVISSVDELQKHGFSNISLSMVKTLKNASSVPEFIQLCKNLRVKPIIRLFAAEGRGAEQKDELYIHEKSLEFNVEQINKKVHLKREIVPRCDAEFGSVFIDAKGDIYPCQPFHSNQFLLGNIFQISSLKEFILTEEYKKTIGFNHFEQITASKNIECASCDVNYFCWHCGFIHESEKRDNKYYKDWCEFNKSRLSYTLWGD